jgi:hypothetical protein
MRNKNSEQSLVNSGLRIQNTEARFQEEYGIQNTEVRIQKKKYSDSCLLTPEFLVLYS